MKKFQQNKRKCKYCGNMNRKRGTLVCSEVCRLKSILLKARNAEVQALPTGLDAVKELQEQAQDLKMGY